MSIVIATGSNIGDKASNLTQAKEKLSYFLTLIASSQIYRSDAIEYKDQPYFLNQVLEFEETESFKSPKELMFKLLLVEQELGRIRNIPKGPRIIDIDLLFWDNLHYKDQIVEVPHPRSFERSFVVLPLKELPAFKKLSQTFNFPDTFSNIATPI